VIKAANEKSRNSSFLGQVLWVEWIQPDSIRVLTEVQKLPGLKDGQVVQLREVISESDLSRVMDFFHHLDEGCDSIKFTLKTDPTPNTSIHCISYKDETHVRCLWKIDDIERNDSFQMLATIAHDLRSPINSILGLTNVLQIMLKDEIMDKKEFGRMISMIKTSCNNALDFSGDLLELSEIESNYYQLKTEQVKVNEFINRFLDTHRLITLKKGLAVKMVSELDDDYTFLLNENKITRLLGNLLSNATKFSHPNGIIYFKLEGSSRQLTIKVIDEGVGMSPEIVNDLIVKFGKSQRLGLEGEKSHGLGMSIVQQIVKLHNGKIYVQSEEGIGTTITLHFKIK